MVEFTPIPLDEAKRLFSMFAPEDRQCVRKMADVDENEIFDPVFAFLDDVHREPASKSATDCTELGCPENDCLTEIFPFAVREHVQKSAGQIQAGIKDLKRREDARFAMYEQAIDQLRATVEKMAGQVPADTIRDEYIYGEDGAVDDRSIFDDLFPARLPAMAG